MTTVHKEPSWFEQVSPGLLRNKCIRNYLSQYTSRDWPEVVKLSLLYGILAIQKQHPGEILTVQQLRDILAAGHVALTVEKAIPAVRSQLDDLQLQLEEVTDEVYEPRANAAASSPIHGNQQKHPLQPSITLTSFPAAAGQPVKRVVLPPTPEPPGLAAVKAVARSPPRLHRSSSNPVVKPIPPSDWRYDDTRTWSPPGKQRSPVKLRKSSPGSLSSDDVSSLVYPAWWGDGSDKPPPAREQARQQPLPQAPPRLAYSVPAASRPAVYENDLVTSQYLNVPSRYLQNQQLNQQHPLQTQLQSLQQQQQVSNYPPAAPAPMGSGPPGNSSRPWWAAGSVAGPWQQQQQQQPAYTAMQPSPLAAVTAAAGPAPLFMLHPSGYMVPVATSAGAGSQELRKKAVHPSRVESRIKAQVAHDREVARNAKDARKRAIQQALYSRPGKLTTLAAAQLQPFPATAAAAAAAASTKSPSTPAEIADRLESNPWTAWFTQGQSPISNNPPTSSAPAAPAPGGAAGSSAVPQVASSSSPPQGQSGHNDASAPVSAAAFPPQQPPQAMQPSQPPQPPSWPTQWPFAWGGSAGSLPAVPPPMQQAPPAASGWLRVWQQPAADPGAWHVFDRFAEGSPSQVAAATHHQAAEVHPSRGGWGRGHMRPERRYEGVRSEVAKWSKTWVGDYGHLSSDEPRFPADKAFKHHQQQHEEEDEGATPTNSQQANASIQEQPPQQVLAAMQQALDRAKGLQLEQLLQQMQQARLGAQQEQVQQQPAASNQNASDHAQGPSSALEAGSSSRAAAAAAAAMAAAAAVTASDEVSRLLVEMQQTRTGVQGPMVGSSTTNAGLMLLQQQQQQQQQAATSASAQAQSAREGYVGSAAPTAPAMAAAAAAAAAAKSSPASTSSNAAGLQSSPLPIDRPPSTATGAARPSPAPSPLLPGGHSISSSTSMSSVATEELVRRSLLAMGGGPVTESESEADFAAAGLSGASSLPSTATAAGGAGADNLYAVASSSMTVAQAEQAWLRTLTQITGLYAPTTVSGMPATAPAVVEGRWDFDELLARASL